VQSFQSKFIIPYPETVFRIEMAQASSFAARPDRS